MNIKKELYPRKTPGYKSNQQPYPLPLSFSWCLTAGMPSRELAALLFSCVLTWNSVASGWVSGAAVGDPCFSIYTSCSPFAFG